MRKPWAIYIRVSTEDQAREGTSLEVQRIACQGMLQFMGHAVGEVFEDAGHSAKDLHRPAAERMLAKLDAGELAGICVYKLDRLTRSVIDLFELLQRFTKVGAELASVREKIDTSSAMGRFFVGLIGLIAQWEREQISERVQSGINHRRAAGGFVGGLTPIGIRVEGPPGGRVRVKDEATAPAVAEVWSRLLAGSSLREVGEWLTSQGAGGPWSVKGVHGVARNERYVGLLVDRGTFDAAGAVLDSRSAPGKSASGRRTISNPSTHTLRVWPLSGLARCGRCGAGLVGVHAVNGGGIAFPYLRCGGRVRHGKAHCDAKDLPAEVWEAFVVDALCEAVRADGELPGALLALGEQFKAQAAPLQGELLALTMERDAAAERVRNLAALAAEGGAVARGLGPAISREQALVEQAEARMAAIEGQMVGAELGEAEAELLADAIRHRLSELKDADPEEQAATLKAVLRYVTIRAPDPGKDTGEVDLSINLPSSYARQPMVERRPWPTNFPDLVLKRRGLVLSRREWRLARGW